MKTQIAKLMKLVNKAYKADEVPVAAMIIKNNKIITKKYNKKQKRKDVTAHAEILAIRRAAQKAKTWNLEGAELVVTLEPCLMCIIVAEEARIKKIYYMNQNKKSGGIEEYKKIRNNVEFIKLDTNIEYEKKMKKFFKNKRE